MRIVKKEKIDVKKFMEEIKANRTNRSFTSLEHRNTRPPGPMTQNRTAMYQNFSKGSAPPQMYHSPSFNGDSYRFYSNHSQMSQMSQNSQHYLPSQLNSAYNHPQPYFPYGQPIYGTTAGIPCHIQGTIGGTPYNMQGYPPTNTTHVGFTPNDQCSNQISGVLFKAERVTDNNYGDQTWKKPNPPAKIQEVPQRLINQEESKDVEADRKQQTPKAQITKDAQVDPGKKKQKKKKENKQKEEPGNKQSLQIKKQLEEVISKQRTQMLQEKKRARIIHTIWEDFSSRLEQCLKGVNFQVATERLRMQANRVFQTKTKMVGGKVEKEKRAWQRLQSEVLEKIEV